jgi:PBP1b-binding outer membrane lipoprotein LpoB
MKLVVVSVALAALTLSGCSSGGRQAGPTSSPATTTPSATPPSPTDLAKVQALAMVPVYLKTIDELYNDSRIPLNNLYDVSAQPDALVELKAIGLSRSNGNRQSGTVTLVRATVNGVDLNNRPKAKPGSTVRRSVEVLSGVGRYLTG